MQFAIPDAPAADELVVVIGAATGGRPHHRIGDRYKDLEELGHDVKTLQLSITVLLTILSKAERASGSDPWSGNASCGMVSTN